MIRTRIAPSPTGDPHVGTAYVALANYAFAKRGGGAFVLRIEDTDQARSTPESEAAILRSLRWLGLSWDEGPDVGGPHAPYRQSQRSAIYERYANELLEAGNAFRCFCTPDRLEEMRQVQRLAKVPSRYDGLCLAIPPAESKRRAGAGEAFVVRLKVPSDGSIVVHDLRRGPTVFEWNAVDMQVLMKSDGLPTYHLANVVDDHLMEITHVIRGEEWISSAPKHLLLYEYFGWKAPVLMHLPLLRNPDRSKLSKRKNPTSILFFERMGYLPDALLNFLGLLLAPVESEAQELFGIDDLVRRLDFNAISLGGPVFDVAKLDWINGHYIRKKSPAELEEAFAEWTYDRKALHEIVALAQDRIERLSDLGPLCAFLFAGRVDVTRELLLGAKIDAETARKALALAMWRLDDAPLFDKTTIESELKGVAGELSVKFRDLVRLYYVAIAGSPTSLPLFDSMALLGRDLCRERLRTALAELGGVSAAEQKAWRAA
ncbi:MAG: glutamate--tRNA ligase [Candidatus Eremiobacteraeota bacterium]|nr:glutamate--tRNA ligase [Candidatus Eremiobacteraeota bacterium]